MSSKRFAGFAVAALFYAQAALGLVAIGVLVQKPAAIDAGYGLTIAQAADLVQRF
jgi:hypothetical protein